MQILWSHYSPTESESPGWGPQICIFNKLPRQFVYTLKFVNHYSKQNKPSPIFTMPPLNKDPGQLK